MCRGERGERGCIGEGFGIGAGGGVVGGVVEGVCEVDGVSICSRKSCSNALAGRRMLNGI